MCKHGSMTASTKHALPSTPLRTAPGFLPASSPSAAAPGCAAALEMRQRSWQGQQLDVICPQIWPLKQYIIYKHLTASSYIVTYICCKLVNLWLICQDVRSQFCKSASVFSEIAADYNSMGTSSNTNTLQASAHRLAVKLLRVWQVAVWRYDHFSDTFLDVIASHRIF